MNYSFPIAPHWLVLAFLGGLFVVVSCTSDQLPAPVTANCATESPTYTIEIAPIIDESCAYSGCHLDSSPGRFNSYSGLLPYLQSNSFRQRVIISRTNAIIGMPPDNAPAGRPKDLTEEQLNLVECWLDAGFPE
ncbi:MAG: hypothetical protein DA408_04755 [Bacteroidetes bacterium]|nr:MAG: hypothetical protein C7N36_15820 [Bacteroidota bacterium]PTM13912.1 MAG: hypothetical protein DA408_04755 [Bacteroidota bacterium]